MIPVVDVRNANFGYNHHALLSNVSFELAEAGSVTLVGGNGSGKSTLLKSLAGLLKPLSGDIKLCGKNPGKSPTDVAYLSQFHKSSEILPIRVFDVVLMGRYAHLGLIKRSRPSRDGSLVEEALEQMGITDLADLPLRSLSGGQRQRVYIAQALCRQPKVLLLDEPTNNLDVSAIKDLESVLAHQRSHGVGLITATHDLADAAASDLVLLLNHCVIACGPPSEVLNDENLSATFGFVPTGIRTADPHGHIEPHAPHPHSHG